MNFVSRLNANNPQSKEDVKRIKQFIKQIEPRQIEDDTNNKAKKTQWNERVQRKIEERKKREAKNEK